MAATPQERLALGVAALLLAAGAAARVLTAGPAPAELDGPAPAEAGASRLAARVADEVAKEERRSTPLAAGEKIDVNTASVDELDRLPKVGPAVAQRIVDRREARGPFRTIADLDSVPGVGPALLKAAGPHLTLPPLSSTRGSFQSAASVADWDRSPEKVTARSPASSGSRVDVNTATAAQLEALPEIGPAIAEAIVEHRRVNGPFRSVDALGDVSGIGPKTLERVRAHVRVTP